MTMTVNPMFMFSYGNWKCMRIYMSSFPLQCATKKKQQDRLCFTIAFLKARLACIPEHCNLTSKRWKAHQVQDDQLGENEEKGVGGLLHPQP